MKATLEFTLPEEASEYEAAVSGFVWKGVVQELAENLRLKVKHQPSGVNNDHATVELIQEQLFELLTDRKLSLD